MKRDFIKKEKHKKSLHKQIGLWLREMN